MGHFRISVSGVTNFSSDPDSPISDLISTTIRITRMIPTPYLYPYMGFGIHQPYRIAYGWDQRLLRNDGHAENACATEQHAWLQHFLPVRPAGSGDWWEG